MYDIVGVMMNTTIRTATVSDAASLLDIYSPYVRDTAITFEYDIPTVSEFAQRIENTLVRYPYFVAVHADQIIGYAYASRYRLRPAYDWAAETTIYIHPQSQDRGVGTALYRELEGALKRQNIQNMYACISYPNPASISFHERMGFRHVGRFSKCGYKLGAWYDIVWMEKLIGPHTDGFVPAPVLPYLS